MGAAMHWGSVAGSSWCCIGVLAGWLVSGWFFFRGVLAVGLGVREDDDGSLWQLVGLLDAPHSMTTGVERLQSVLLHSAPAPKAWLPRSIKPRGATVWAEDWCCD